MRKLIIVLAALVVMLPASALAQDKIVIDVNYVGGDHSKLYNYTFFGDGKRYDAAGSEFSLKMKLGDGVSAGYRREWVSLSNARSVINGFGFDELSTKDNLFYAGSAKYREFYGSFKLPKTHGHALVVGFVKTIFAREWRGGTTRNKRSDTFEGLTVGGEGRQKIGHLTLDYSGRWYLRGMGETVKGSNIPDEKYISSGCELRGTATWAVTKHIGLTGGYEYRRFQADRKEYLLIDEVQTIKVVVVGARLSF